ncbi:MAG TPA: APC family permease, partial [Dehalococcoidia bacterium]|nr:APC family permease [Dehalococcoidia bacterium]
MSASDAGSIAIEEQRPRGLSLRGATFLGVGSMVGAGIFTLLGEAGAVAGSAVWISFLLGGFVALLMGYTVAKLGTRFPASGGLVTFFVEGYGNGHRAGIASWIMYFTALVVSAMVAVSFGNYASELLFEDKSDFQVKTLAALVVLAMGAVNVVGANVVEKVQTLIVLVVLTVFAVFIVATWSDMDTDLLRRSTYPDTRYIISSVGLTFFAFLGFAVISFTAADVEDPEKNVPRATYSALGIATVLYVLIALGVFGTLTVAEVIGFGGTALAEAARPSLGDAGFAMMAITAVLATTSSTNANVYTVKEVTQKVTEIGQFPGVMARRSPVQASWGLVISLGLIIILSVFFDLTAIASIGSAAALGLFLLLGMAAYRLREETNSSPLILLLAIVLTAGVLLIFVADTLDNDPDTFVAIAVIFALAVLLEFIISARRQEPVEPVAATS